MTGLCIEVHGLRVGVRVTDARVLDRIPGYLPTGWTPAAPGPVDRAYTVRTDREITVDRGTGRPYRTSTLDDALHFLEYDLELFVVTRSPGRVFVHAGVVEWRGRAVVIPGRSFSGKSTLTAALCRAGAVYYSDEYALFDADGFVHPYARPLRLRPGGPPAPRLVAGKGPLPVGLVALARFEAGAEWCPGSLSPGRAVLALLEHTMAARRRADTALSVLRRAVAAARCVEGERGEADRAAGAILRLAEEGPSADSRSFPAVPLPITPCDLVRPR